MRTRGRTRLLTSAAVAATLVLGGCASDSSDDNSGDDAPVAEPNGVGDMDAQEILDAASEAVEGASSVHAVGEGLQDGETLAIDLQMTADGTASGSVTIQGQQVDLVLVDGATYFAADEAFWTAQIGPELAAEVGDKFVELPANDDSFSEIGDYTTFFAGLLEPEGEIEKGEETTVDGVPAIALIDLEDNGELLIALEGEPLPLKVSSTEEEGELLLTEWNETVTVEAPAADQVVDLESLTS